MALTSLRKLKRREFSVDDAKRFFNEIRKEKSDYGAVLLSCSLLDEALHLSIYFRLPGKSAAEKLFEDRAPLTSLSAKIALAHALDLYGDGTRRNLDTIRAIRNIFAHEMSPLTFDTPEIGEACSHLTQPPTHAAFPGIKVPFATPRERFVATAIGIAVALVMNPLGTLWEGEPNEVRPIHLP